MHDDIVVGDEHIGLYTHEVVRAWWDEGVMMDAGTLIVFSFGGSYEPVYVVRGYSDIFDFIRTKQWATEGDVFEIYSFDVPYSEQKSEKIVYHPEVTKVRETELTVNNVDYDLRVSTVEKVFFGFEADRGAFVLIIDFKHLDYGNQSYVVYLDGLDFTFMRDTLKVFGFYGTNYADLVGRRVFTLISGYHIRGIAPLDDTTNTVIAGNYYPDEENS